MNDELRFKRVVLKLSGEVLQGDTGYGIAPSVMETLAEQIVECDRSGLQLTIVVGGGNIFRGLAASRMGMDRVDADYMGMMATVINGLALKDALRARGASPRLFSALEIEAIGEQFSRDKAITHLEKGGINIAVAGTGRPFFTTDTAAALRGLETDADALLKATRVDGVYDRDPEEDEDAIRFEHLGFMDALDKNLRVMDLAATSLCRDNNLPIVVFNIKKDGNLKRVVEGKHVGTLIDGGDNHA
ncbi:MAG: UMP kinase [bacterium]